MSRQVALVTGASTGLGAEISQKLLEDGYIVIGTSRSSPEAIEIVRSEVNMLKLDVCEASSVERLHSSLSELGYLPDLIVLNAGMGISGSVEETPIAMVQTQMETNFIGAHRMVRSFLPRMRENRTGQIIFIGSLMGQVSIPFQAFYCASKAALASYAAALRMEVLRFGINVSVVEPGDHKSDFGSARISASKQGESVYDPVVSRAVEVMAESEKDGAPGRLVANLVAKIAKKRSPKFKYLRASGFEYFMLGLRALFPASWFEAVVMGVYKVPNR